jgi:hypothetical protein
VGVFAFWGPGPFDVTGMLVFWGFGSSRACAVGRSGAGCVLGVVVVRR